jgi:FMN phosphatase YigB (HAD superfamily)
MSKPDPRIYALACARLGVRPDETVFLGDSDLCVTGACRAGIHAIRYRANAQAIEEIETLLTRGGGLWRRSNLRWGRRGPPAPCGR